MNRQPEMVVLDGNTAAAHVAYRVNDRLSLGMGVRAEMVVMVVLRHPSAPPGQPSSETGDV